MSFCTHRGDGGETELLGGKRVPKDHPLVAAVGEIDEFNALLGVVLAFSERPNDREVLIEIQKDLFLIGTELSGNGKARISKRINSNRVAELEQGLDSIEKELPTLTHFILPGGSRPASLFHLARTVCRRAERSIVTLSKKQKIDPQIPIYLNRLGDLLFMMARKANREKRVDEVIWRGNRIPGR
jgi:cob(I)alamin adenosyltransferase